MLIEKASVVTIHFNFDDPEDHKKAVVYAKSFLEKNYHFVRGNISENGHVFDDCDESDVVITGKTDCVQLWKNYFPRKSK